MEYCKRNENEPTNHAVSYVVKLHTKIYMILEIKLRERSKVYKKIMQYGCTCIKFKKSKTKLYLFLIYIQLIKQ